MLIIIPKKAIIILFLVIFFPQVSSADLKIGVILPLSGEISLWGEGVRRGLELFKNSYPDKVTFIYEDEAYCNNKLAVNALTKLIQQDKVKIVIPGCLNGIKAMLPIAEKNQVLLLSSGFLDDESLDNYSNLISLSAQIGTEALYVAEHIKEHGYKNPSLFRHDDAFTAKFLRALKENLKTEKTIELNDFPVVDPNHPWSSELLKTKKSNSDLYILWLGKDELHSFLKAKFELKDKTSVLSGYILESICKADEFDGLLEGLTYSYPELSPLSDSKRISFEKSFRDLFGINEKPTVNTYFVYDGMQALLKAAESCKDSSNSCMKNYLIEKPWSGVSGSFNFDQSGKIKRNFIFKQVKDGKYQELAKN